MRSSPVLFLHVPNGRSPNAPAIEARGPNEGFSRSMQSPVGYAAPSATAASAAAHIGRRSGECALYSVTERKTARRTQSDDVREAGRTNRNTSTSDRNVQSDDRRGQTP